MTCIVAYDIKNDKKRRRISRYIEKRGVRLQRSVFAVELEDHQFEKFMHELFDIAGEADKIAVFRLCQGCMKKALRTRDQESAGYQCI